MIKGLKQSLTQKDEGKTESRFFKLQKVLFDFVDKFEFAVHPILAMLENILPMKLWKLSKKVILTMLKVR
jgi:hypothetical protein